MRLLAALPFALAALLLPAPAEAAVAPVRWCGNDQAQGDRVPDRAGGSQIHVVYAIPADGEDRFAALGSGLATDVAAIDAWWRREDPARAPRFDLFEFPGCDSRFGRLDLGFVRLVDTGAALTPLETRYERIQGTLAGLGLNSGTKKYLVFYDGFAGSGQEADVCGIAGGSPVGGGIDSLAIVFLRAACPTQVGDGATNAYVAAHELLHMLGALPPGAPHACPGDFGHPCDSSGDVLWPFYDVNLLDGAHLDVGRDDYYGHGQGWFDIRSSRWLLDAQAQLELGLALAGSGTLRLEPGTTCTSSCVTEWDRGSELDLVAEPAESSRFRGWSGACAGRVPACTVSMDVAKTVTASFGAVVTLSVSVSGRGVVAAGGVRCVRACTQELVEGDAVALRASAARGWHFVRWSGRCRGSRPTCTVRLGGSTRVGAVFARR